MGYLYKLDFSSGKSYIGITKSKTFSARIRGHRCDASIVQELQQQKQEVSTLQKHFQN